MTPLRIPSWRTALIAGSITGTVLALVMAIMLWRADPARTAPHQVVVPAPASSSPSGDIPPVPPSDDPVGFARSVATTVFAWDTTAPIPLDAYSDRVVAVGDPSGFETPGLVADVARYLPTAEAWEFLSRYATRQWLDITAAVVPASWPGIVANAPEGALAEGTTAVTIDGVRHRAGVWEGKAVHDRFTVSFTVFVVCVPTYPTCYLLRLSELDNPLR